MNKLSLSRLKIIARKSGSTGYSTLNKNDLIDFIGKRTKSPNTTVIQLKKMAKELGAKNYSNVLKKDLVRLVNYKLKKSIICSPSMKTNRLSTSLLKSYRKSTPKNKPSPRRQDISILEEIQARRVPTPQKQPTHRRQDIPMNIFEQIQARRISTPQKQPTPRKQAIPMNMLEQIQARRVDTPQKQAIPMNMLEQIQARRVSTPQKQPTPRKQAIPMNMLQEIQNGKMGLRSNNSTKVKKQDESELEKIIKDRRLKISNDEDKCKIDDDCGFGERCISEYCQEEEEETTQSQNKLYMTKSTPKRVSVTKREENIKIKGVPMVNFAEQLRQKKREIEEKKINKVPIVPEKKIKQNSLQEQMNRFYAPPVKSDVDDDDDEWK